ncbi:MAG TPA: NAD(P)-dependent oxidoreductase [Conexibacter sp.]|nr:NAD(P)-dependent oxidoreductase [Conexibacter sp.]
MRALVTGASGFLGGFACRELHARGHAVTALVRRPGSAPPDCEEVRADLAGDPASLTAALAAARPDCALHLAAEIATQRDAAKLAAVNVAGTARLLEACAAAGSPKVVFASTVVTGDAHGALLDEDTALPVETAYGRSKQEGERLLRACGLPGVVVRPSHVYGPGGWFAHELVARLRQPGRFAVVGRGENWWDVVHVADVARALCDAAESAPAGATYHVADDAPIRLADFAATIAAALGTGPPRHVPVWLARLAAGRDPVAAVTRSARSSNARIKRELGWSPQYPTAADGVPAAVAALA